MKALTSHWQILFFIGILANYLIGIFLEIDYQSCIELSACQVIRYSILLVVDVGDPVIGTDIFISNRLNTSTPIQIFFR